MKIIWLVQKLITILQLDVNLKVIVDLSIV